VRSSGTDDTPVQVVGGATVSREPAEEGGETETGGPAADDHDVDVLHWTLPTARRCSL
jgi:hypothetical protein